MSNGAFLKNNNHWVPWVFMLFWVYVYAESSTDAPMPSLHRTNGSAAFADIRPDPHSRPAAPLSLWSHVELLDEARWGETALRGLQWGNKVLEKQTVQHEGSGSKFNGSVAQSLHGVGWRLAESNSTHAQVVKSFQKAVLRRQKVRNV